MSFEIIHALPAAMGGKRPSSCCNRAWVETDNLPPFAHSCFRPSSCCNSSCAETDNLPFPCPQVPEAERLLQQSLDNTSWIDANAEKFYQWQLASRGLAPIPGVWASSPTLTEMDSGVGQDRVEQVREPFCVRTPHVPPSLSWILGLIKTGCNM